MRIHFISFLEQFVFIYVCELHIGFNIHSNKMVQKMTRDRSIKIVKYMIQFFVTTVIVKTCVESSQVQALEEILQDRNRLLNSGLQNEDRYGGKKNHFSIRYWC